MRICIILSLLVISNNLSGQQLINFYGLSKSDIITSMVKTKEGGFIFVGSSTTISNGGRDIWVIKTDDSLKFVWQRNFGKTFDEFGIETFLEGDEIIVIGRRISPNFNDIWIFGMDLRGNKNWEKNYRYKNNVTVHSVEKIDDFGYVITGEEKTIKNNLQGFVILLNDSAELVWKRVYGGKNADGLLNTKRLEDGFISIGYTNSIRKSGLKIPETSYFQRLMKIFIRPKISQEVWLIQMDRNGEKMWEKTYGGDGTDIGKFIFSSSDSSYTIMGDTKSFKKSEGDVWVIRIDDEGKEIWNKTYGGKSTDVLRKSKQIEEGKYILSVSSNKKGKFFGMKKQPGTRNILISHDGNVSWDVYPLNQDNITMSNLYVHEKQIFNVGYEVIPFSNEKVRFEELIGVTQYPEKIQALVFEMDTLGKNLGQYAFSTDRSEYGVKLIQKENDQYTVLTNMDTYNKGEYDVSILEFNSQNNVTKSFNMLDSGNQIATGFYITNDDNLVIIGEVYSSKYAGIDLFIQRYDKNRNLLWKNEFGGFGNDLGLDIVNSIDGSSIIAGRTDSFGSGGTDGWLMKVDSVGNLVWTKSYGGKSLDGFSSIRKTRSGNYILSGSTQSSSSNEELWVMQVDESGDDLWEKTYGGLDNDKGILIEEISSGDFILVGQTQSSIQDNGQNILIAKLDSTGTEAWLTEVGGRGDKIANSFCSLKDVRNGFIIIGELKTTNAKSKILMVKINQRGKIIWERTYGGNYISYGCSVKDDGNRLVVMGNHDIDSNGNSEIILFKTDYDGLLLSN